MPFKSLKSLNQQSAIILIMSNKKVKEAFNLNLAETFHNFFNVILTFNHQENVRRLKKISFQNLKSYFFSIKCFLKQMRMRVNFGIIIINFFSITNHSCK